MSLWVWGQHVVSSSDIWMRAVYLIINEGLSLPPPAGAPAGEASMGGGGIQEIGLRELPSLYGLSRTVVAPLVCGLYAPLCLRVPPLPICAPQPMNALHQHLRECLEHTPFPPLPPQSGALCGMLCASACLPQLCGAIHMIP